MKMTNPFEIEARLRKLADATGNSLEDLRSACLECVRVWGEACAIRQLELYEREFAL
jgi:hypothetical protein